MGPTYGEKKQKRTTNPKATHKNEHKDKPISKIKANEREGTIKQIEVYTTKTEHRATKTTTQKQTNKQKQKQHTEWNKYLDNDHDKTQTNPTRQQTETSTTKHEQAKGGEQKRGHNKTKRLIYKRQNIKNNKAQTASNKNGHNEE